jgi:PAP2 superfamily
LIGITQVLASHVAMVAKHHLACRRPVRIGPKVMPMIPTPAHGSFPSAHATEAFSVATVMSAFVEENKEYYSDFEKRQKLLHKLAERIAVNRTVAGVHYPIDTWCGSILGRALGQIILAKCGIGLRHVDHYSYEANGDGDFFLGEFEQETNTDFGVRKLKHFTVKASDEFAWLWGKASEEFNLHRLA